MKHGFFRAPLSSSAFYPRLSVAKDVFCPWLVGLRRSLARDSVAKGRAQQDSEATYAGQYRRVSYRKDGLFLQAIGNLL